MEFGVTVGVLVFSCLFRFFCVLGFSRMTRLWSEGEPIQMETNSDGSPVRFGWRSRTYRLQRIQQQWQVDSDWWSPEGRVWRNYYALLTTDGLLCVVYNDLLHQEWRIARVYD
jgi:hypothetical protein